MSSFVWNSTKEVAAFYTYERYHTQRADAAWEDLPYDVDWLMQAKLRGFYFDHHDEHDLGVG